MGTYVIPGVGFAEARQIIDHARQQGALTERQTWDWAGQGGTLFTDPDRSDAACAALYAGFTPDPNWRPALPDALRAHASHLRDFEQAVRAGTPVTNAQTLHVIADIIAWIRLSEDRL